MKHLAKFLLVYCYLSGPPAIAGYFDCSVIYDEFESLMNKQFLLEPDRYVTTINDRATAEEYQRLQRGQFVLYDDRAGEGIIIFRSNENLHGKLLYHFSEPLGDEVHLLIDEVVVFARTADGYGPVRYGPVRLKPNFGLDLDSGKSYVLLDENRTGSDEQEYKRADLAYRFDSESGHFVIEAANDATLKFPIESLCHRPGQQPDAKAGSPSSARSMPLPPSPPVSRGVPASR